MKVQLHKDVEQVLLTNSDIVIACEEIAKQISADYKDTKPILICILKGAVPYLAELLKHLTIDVELDFMKVSSYSGSSSKGEVQIIDNLTLDIEGRDVIIVDDIIDTGITINNVVKYFVNLKAKSVVVTTLLDKPSARKRDVYVKYVGYKVPNRYLVGFGLDYSEQYRSLPYVGILKKKIYEND